ncbi:MAG: UDP-N-acetylmuramate dehydrogenase [Deltaproteobacteria bacterium]|nr:UDP-N-acetylmuramate dehydrogenase [Deltaproteobacteria bacterium]
MTKEVREDLAKCAHVRFDEPMSAHTTLGVGGPADAFCDLETIEELKNVMRLAVEHRLPYFFLGGGSNLLVQDGGIRGLVLRLGGDFKIYQIGQDFGDEVLLEAGAAAHTPQLVRWSLEQGLQGMEVLAGVPGTIGGNVMMNAGTKLGCLADLIDEITVLDRNAREMTMKAKSLRFEYRHLKLPSTACVLRAVFRLKRSAALQGGPSLGDLLAKRRATQPVAEQSCGCVFKNPPKISAGQLIEESGLKGVRIGKVRISTLHGNFFINEGGATAREIMVLIRLVKDRVKEATGITLETEVVIVGEEKRR